MIIRDMKDVRTYAVSLGCVSTYYDDKSLVFIGHKFLAASPEEAIEIALSVHPSRFPDYVVVPGNASARALGGAL
jgi:hypothetical protein